MSEKKKPDVAPTEAKAPDKAATKKPRKPEAARKGVLLQVRVTAAQKLVLTKAAAKDGLDVSSWLRALGIERARQLGIELPDPGTGGESS